MPYNPHVENRVGESIGAGILQASQALAEGMQKRDEARKQDAWSRAMLDYYHDKGQLDPEEYAKALRGSASGRAAIIAGVQAEQHDNLVKSQQQNQLAYDYYSTNQQAGIEGQRLGIEQTQATAEAAARGRQLDISQQEANTEQTRAAGESTTPKAMGVPGLEGYYMIPKTGQIIPPPGAGGPEVSPDGRFYRDGKVWRPIPAKTAGKGDGAAPDPRAAEMDDVNNKISDLIKDATDRKRKLTEKAGITGFFGPTYQEQLDTLKAHRDALQQDLQTGGGSAPGGAPPEAVEGNGNPPAPVQTPAPGSGAGPGPATAPPDPLGQAKAAIAAGADPEKVKARLKENGVDPGGL